MPFTVKILDRLNVQVALADIAKEDVDAIVNPVVAKIAGGELNDKGVPELLEPPPGSVSDNIFSAGGPQFRGLVSMLIEENGTIPVGQCSKSMKSMNTDNMESTMKAKYVIHAVGPKWDKAEYS